MASVAIPYGVVAGGVKYSIDDDRRTSLRTPSSNQNSIVINRAIVVAAGGKKISATIPMSMSLSKNQEPIVKTREPKKQDKTATAAASYENVIDGWMRDSVVEIVKNLRESPLLVHVYGNGDGNVTSLKTEKAVPDNWLTMRNEWENGTAPMPEGVIFVEQIKDEEVEEEEAGNASSFTESEITRAWGIVVQAKGENYRPNCYLLKTSRAGSGSGSGLGLCCTHYCLMKVNSFRETAETQFKNCWLLNSQWR